MANNYTLGRGELHFAKFKPNTRTPGGERYIGNSPEFSATISSDNLDHYNSDHGVNEKDASIVLNMNRSATFTTDNISSDNIALFFFGETDAFATVAATVTDEVLNIAELGYTYQLGMTAANPIGAKNLAVHTVGDPDADPVVPTVNIIVKNSAGATTYVEGVDYTVDLDKGRITILESGAIVENASLKVTYKTQTSTRTRVISGNTPVEGSLRFIPDNPEGDNFEWYMPWVKLRPNGDYALKGDNWQTIPFTVEILKPEDKFAIYIDGVPMTA